jgi:predicted DNA-binding transcriptional regulator YafY
LETAERCFALLKLICRRRYDTIANLASEFNVSERTIRRDIEYLMCTESIYTKSGRYGGGVYVVDTYTMDRMYFSEEELAAVTKLFECSQQKTLCELTEDETRIMKKLIKDYTKPQKAQN